MPHVTSRDGTRIAYDVFGSGPPLVLVHGTGGARVRWKPVVPALSERFTLYAIDRRGRGESGDAEHYAIEREFEDVAAVVDSLAAPVYLLGHSYGAICSLEAALLTTKLARLVLYEPPLPLPGFEIQQAEAIAKLEAQLARGDREGLLTTFMTEVVRMPPHEFDVFRGSPAWPARLAAAHTLPRELAAHRSYQFRAERFRGLELSTLLLVGGDSPPFFAAAAAALQDTLPRNELVVLSGQQHIAIDTAPELFVREVLAFLTK